MPPIYHMDQFDSCLKKIGDTYCTVQFGLIADGPNELLSMIHVCILIIGQLKFS